MVKTLFQAHVRRTSFTLSKSLVKTHILDLTFIHYKSFFVSNHTRKIQKLLTLIILSFIFLKNIIIKKFTLSNQPLRRLSQSFFLIFFILNLKPFWSQILLRKRITVLNQPSLFFLIMLLI